MGLDSFFFRVEKKQEGYFRKLNFLLTYFDVGQDDNCEEIPISEEEFSEFVADLKCELTLYKERRAKDSSAILDPINPKFRAKEVFFGGSTSYDSSYWDSLRQVYSWANSLLISFDWEAHTLIFQNWW